MTATELAERYSAVWNEPDPGARRRAIEAIWTEDALALLQPPLEMIATADELGVALSLRVRGHDELAARVTRAYEQFVAPDENVFRARPDAQQLDDVVKWGWELVPAGGDEILGGGLTVVKVDRDGRITHDYTFVDP
ncbi:MAG TPA: hypothetical protein VFX51_08125 [Solirubrobacteraceae bacterium]|nr:hypothetical protein [Solirubrobacteraceae bacterium]